VEPLAGEELVTVKIRVFGREDKVVRVPRGSTIERVIRLLSLNPVEVVAAKNGEVVTEEEEVEDGDFIELYSVVSGG